MDLGLADKVVLVTGGSQGIGKQAVLQFAAEGARVAFTYKSGKERAAEIVQEVEKRGGQALAVEMELGSVASCRAAVDATVKRFGRVDVLVNNAVRWADQAPGRAPAFEDFPLAEWQGVLHDNVDGAFACIQAALPSMRARRWGRIINLSSGVALDGVVGTSPYAMAKAAMLGLTNVLARELGPEGILVNTVVPGLTVTERTGPHLPDAYREQRGKAYMVGRLLEAKEVAPTIVFLCSELNTAVTGETIRASGGRP